MEATDILTSEHRVIENVLTTLETAASRLEAGEEVRPGLFIQAAEFIRGFADGCHHMKEEGVLFKMMNEHGAPVQGGPIGVMLQEHEQGRIYTRAMNEAAKQLEAGNVSAKPELIQAAYGYTSLLRQHILKEDNILFKLADQVIPVEDHFKVIEGFDRVEHEETGTGVHEKYLALAETLQREVGL